jgi:hypothetical protein
LDGITDVPTELLINSYFNIVKREMIDMVPKAITLTLVNHSKENLQRELLQELYKPEILDDMLKESEHVVARRKEVMTTLAALNKADEYVLASSSSIRTNLAPQDHRWCVDARSHPVFTPPSTSGYYSSALRMSCPITYRLSCKVSWCTFHFIH